MTEVDVAAAPVEEVGEAGSGSEGPAGNRSDAPATTFYADELAMSEGAEAPDAPSTTQVGRLACGRSCGSLCGDWSEAMGNDNVRSFWMWVGARVRVCVHECYVCVCVGGVVITTSQIPYGTWDLPAVEVGRPKFRRALPLGKPVQAHTLPHFIPPQLEALCLLSVDFATEPTCRPWGS